jgi:hypothetical protein
MRLPYFLWPQQTDPEAEAQRLLNRARDSLMAARCDVAALSLEQLERFLDRLDAIEQGQDTKAGAFLAALGALTIFSLDYTFKNPNAPLYQSIVITILFLASGLHLVLAYRTQPHKERLLETLTAKTRLSCADALDLRNGPDPAGAAHSGEHVLAYRRFIAEHLVDAAAFNRAIVLNKGALIHRGFYLLLVELVAIIIFLFINHSIPPH